MKYRKYERERAEMLKIDEKTALLDDFPMLFPKLTNSDQFENLVRDLYKAKYPNTQLDKYGRTGQKQHGVDITIQGNIEGKQQLWCIQCKNYDSLTTSDVDDILTACTFYDKVKHFEKFIIATYAKRDVNVVEHLLEIRAIGKYPYAIEYAPQDVICDYIEENPVVFNRYYGKVFQANTLKDKCLEILLKYKVEAFLRSNPLKSGMPFNLPEFLEDCCFELRSLLDAHLSEKRETLYKNIEQFYNQFNAYTSFLGYKLFLTPYGESEDGEPLYNFAPNFNDTNYSNNLKTTCQYQMLLRKLLNKIVVG